MVGVILLVPNPSMICNAHKMNDLLLGFPATGGIGTASLVRGLVKSCTSLALSRLLLGLNPASFILRNSYPPTSPSSSKTGSRPHDDVVRQKDISQSKAGSPARAGLPEEAGVFGAGALLPQFLSELTATLNSLICDQPTISGESPQGVFP